MTSIREEAMAYEPVETKNIADLEKVSTEIELEDRSGTDKDGKQFFYKVAIIDGEEYRVPKVVLKQLKVLLEEEKDLLFFKVRKTGEGFNTSYQVLGVRN